MIIETYTEGWLRLESPMIYSKNMNWRKEVEKHIYFLSRFFWQGVKWVLNQNALILSLGRSSGRCSLYSPLAPGECGRREAMDGCREGPRTDPRDPRRSSLCLSCLSSEAFMRRGLGVLKMVLLSLHRALHHTNTRISSAGPGSTACPASSSGEGSAFINPLEFVGNHLESLKMK